jgi:hypothetical protein
MNAGAKSGKTEQSRPSRFQPLRCHQKLGIDTENPFVGHAEPASKRQPSEIHHQFGAAQRHAEIAVKAAG